MPSFTRPGSSVIDYNAVTGDSVTTAAQKQDIALNDLYANIVDGTAVVKGIVRFGTTASTAASGDHLHTGVYAASGANSDITSLSGLTTPLSVAQGGTGGTTALGTAAYVDIGTDPGQIPTNADIPDVPARHAVAANIVLQTTAGGA